MTKHEAQCFGEVAKAALLAISLIRSIAQFPGDLNEDHVRECCQQCLTDNEAVILKAGASMMEAGMRE